MAKWLCSWGKDICCTSACYTLTERYFFEFSNELLVSRKDDHDWLSRQPKQKHAKNACFQKTAILTVKYLKRSDNSCIRRKVIFSAFIWYLDSQNQFTNNKNTRNLFYMYLAVLATPILTMDKKLRSFRIYRQKASYGLMQIHLSFLFLDFYRYVDALKIISCTSHLRETFEVIQTTPFYPSNSSLTQTQTRAYVTGDE